MWKLLSLLCGALWSRPEGQGQGCEAGRAGKISNLVQILSRNLTEFHVKIFDPLGGPSEADQRVKVKDVKQAEQVKFQTFQEVIFVMEIKLNELI